MKVILKDNIVRVGVKGDLVDVKPGYFRNYLNPQGLAVEATKKNMAELEEMQAQLKAEEAENRKEAEELKEKIEAITITQRVNVGEDGKLFGSVTNKDIAEALAEQGIEIDRKRIENVEKIDGAGEFELNVRLYPEINANLKVEVVAEVQ
ncbi:MULTISPECIES: 50S ribosomal protein L9 [Anaerococcus]|jgi:ribosomal protein L9|uniref:Large ribosomal subunit protein bL9 n=1 Tax=Anaerococcus octavius TaxID=54007 RepID=A0A2I1M9C1_9FIRM|nr:MULTISPECIES: 50S ribosomal protein L9 [Anaerococcus]MBS6106708.1 50S ribosomal protein L9 [Anaerococcus sp.]MDU2598278.1 50S ribosomal protein L9 [Anaerococcus sp.]MDU3177190.1 50S ribosomal protein L9 [Anaerococcus sp.]MDU4025596.1 50S ribosomal protein L9 [Anaerococcus sp.]MDU5534840.1 50S ribosomal protein L9 [Anaerococcus sp.]